MSFSKVKDDILSIGVNDPELDLFEGQFPVPNGIAYNSYVIMDKSIAVMDTADIRKMDDYMRNLEEALGGRTPDYLVVQHVEPDHASGFGRFMERYPDVKVVGNAQTFRILGNYFTCPEESRVVVKDGDTLELGTHTLQFVFAPQVHWPEVMVTYDEKTETLFSADAFGKYGTTDTEEPWEDEAARYYFNIIARFGPNVQKLLGKLAGKRLSTICSLHGPVLSDRASICKAIALYDKWSRYEPDKEGIFICYGTMHGNMKTAAEHLADILRQKGCPHVELCDVNRAGLSVTTANAFRYGMCVFMAPSYYGGLFPGMDDFLNHLAEKKYKNRTVGLVEEGSWGPCSARVMRAKLEAMDNINIAEPVPKFLGGFKEEYDTPLAELADALLG